MGERGRQGGVPHGRRSAISRVLLTLLMTAAGLPLALGAGTPANSAPAVRSPLEHDDLSCLEAVPATASISAMTGTGDRISLDVLVLLDGVTRARGIEVMTKAAEAYAPLRVRLRSTFRRVRFPSAARDDPVPRAEVGALFEHLIDSVRGERPKGSDVVYLLTNKDIFIVENGERSYSVAGVAYCIGGVRYADAAFAIGEGVSPWEGTLSDYSFSAKIAAHEIGHVLGAHHHYGNCVQGNGTTDGGGEPSICTVMWPTTVQYAAINFGTLESAVVRGHAVEYAAP
jgi:reprolysin-like metallo-peptidase family M12B